MLAKEWKTNSYIINMINLQIILIDTIIIKIKISPIISSAIDENPYVKLFSSQSSLKIPGNVYNRVKLIGKRKVSILFPPSLSLSLSSL